MWCRTTVHASAARSSRPRSPNRTRYCDTSVPGSGHRRRTVWRFFGTLKYEHLFRGVIAEGDALDLDVHRFRVIYNTIRPHQAIDDSSAFTAASS
ncbi:integrase core domain-containing protein [Nocardia sp. NPDC050630]|uniref:integrase core domain-containing protein n=1 Tax=Nocardia sp. NPDC050630 TaxID=3364321 RepID=UPI00379527A8